MFCLINTDLNLSKKEQESNARKENDQYNVRLNENASVPLPTDWSNFMALEDNKADLALFLSNCLIEHCPAGKTVVVAGGFAEATVVKL